MIRLTLASAICLAASAAFAHPAMTGDPTDMRAAPSSHAAVVQQIPPHAQIDVGECGDRWCAASWRNLDGYVRVEAIAPNDAPLRGPPGPPPPIVVGGPVIVGPAFGYGYYYHRHW
jgi:uncharacterized protein YraI